MTQARAPGYRSGMGELSPNDDQIVLLHNPRCSKSRATKEILEGRGVAFTERRYLEDPLSVAELEDLAGRLGLPISQWVRRKEAAFAEAGLSDSSDEADLRNAVAETPLLMERPIVIRGSRAAIGRPPEAVLALLR